MKEMQIQWDLDSPVKLRNYLNSLLPCKIASHEFKSEQLAVVQFLPICQVRDARKDVGCLDSSAL